MASRTEGKIILRRGALIVGTLLLLGAVMVIWSLPRSVAAPAPQIVRPEDVATPTPTYTVILVPTPTPTLAVAGAQPRVGMHSSEGFSTYVVAPGDTLLSVALEVGVDVDELPCSVAPEFRPDQPLVIGNVLEIPPPGWQCHQVQPGETLAKIGARYGVDPLDLVRVTWNQLYPHNVGDGALVAGNYVRVPPSLDQMGGGGFLNFMLDQPLTVSPVTAYATGGTRARSSGMIGPVPKDWPYGSGSFMWPVYGWMSQGYRGDHRAIDIAAPVGTFVAAADRGVVVRAGWNQQGYGMFVVIDHNIDYMTLYAHLAEVFVREGDVVAQGQMIGTIGSTGNSTGPHLHFEIRDFGRRTNPLDLLMR